MKKAFVGLVLGILLFAFAGSPTSHAQSNAEQPAAKLVVEPPVPELLAKGLVVIQYRTENVRVLPVFGPAALAVSPRIGTPIISPHFGHFTRLPACSSLTRND